MEQTNFSKIDLSRLVTELESQKLKKRDSIVPSRYLSMSDGRLQVWSTTPNDSIHTLGEFKALDSCHRQISDKLNINWKYYERMLIEAPDILDYNVNEWLKRIPANYFIRTFISDDDSPGIARAFLSDRFRVLDHLDILLTALEAIRQTDKRVVIETADLTDQRMYIRFTAPDIIKSAPELLKSYKVPNGGSDSGFGVCSGFILSNSETGHGTFTIAPRLTVLACKNGMILQKDKIAEKHLGSRMEPGSIDWSFNTRQKELELIQSQVKDAVTAYLSDEYLGRVLDDITLKGSKLLDHPIDAIHNISLSLGFTEERKNELLNYFLLGSDPSGFGAVQSITYLAQQVEPDMRYELEMASVNILSDMSKYDRPAVKNYYQLMGN